MNNVEQMEDALRKAGIVLGYKMMGYDAYCEMTKDTESVRKQEEESIKEIGKIKTEKIKILSKIDVLIDFLTLKTITPSDENKFIDEMYKLVQELYTLKGE